VVWDFDGVVADTEPVQTRAYEVVLADLGVDVPGGWFTEWVGTPEAGIWAGVRERYGVSLPVDELVAARAGVYSELAAKLVPAWFVAPVLALPVCHTIVSAGNHSQIVPLQQRWGIADAFAEVLATGSPRVPAGQPKLERLREATKEPGCILFEDSSRYLDAVDVAVKVGVEHQFNDLSRIRCDFLVAHRAEAFGRWAGPTLIA